ncbi:methylenetetrahydrofolate--tRNA-(uracil-5-)-methyltransferase TrmFO [bacterium BMS3Abin07]|nr:methylenetetrahydrofolate--tRNA-(uracil-5-)-methyltransferase TrmFO [bacterium BMS3Abin07]GBE31538.1 methylenetetrahydrofolate--tRNA-(uracil-5-)-methyltransferase TrmFO [bacterium BMS3Bbin05]HDL20244.1 methylenetetrahydrofolate--tRNA-(uracil(54)-C(5))-methyltransferase (FADH(2)-oxidizing) TrmFO [Nitrospirota bacterium]HDO22024.1 methylenetetrahydrofolate--tRNA-(uracil(54)-C(5))-methyltransferase (FADH(2)-oxidizing) TrmFO [Nitrospirota bacterium]HDZ88471.1 methylenetetrahydrofolate--tRNA-(ura
MIISVVGGGLAGSEAAWQASRSGMKVRLYEMRPAKSSAAHKTGCLGELVCSNSLRSDDPVTPSGVLKRELEMAGSLIMESARINSVPAGSALAVDRNLFSEYISDMIADNPYIEIIRKEVSSIPAGCCVVATGPLTSEAMASAIGSLVDSRYLYFHDAIAPIVSADSIDFSKAFYASRYGKGSADYINCPMEEDEYNIFYDELIKADRVNLKEFDNIRVFQGCMPVEVMAERGRDSLRFGPMKPVGLTDPLTGKMPYAVVQLRAENRYRSAYNMVGFQCRIKWPEQRRVFRLIPGLEHGEFLRYGSIHRNTFINSPLFISNDLSFSARSDVYIAGQLSGVEGYLESTAIGLVAGINASGNLLGLKYVPVPETTAHGALVRYITESGSRNFQPGNINIGLFPPLDGKIKDKKLKRKKIAERALQDWREYLDKLKDR